MPELRTAWPWVGGGIALFMASAVLQLDGVNWADESWTLQVVHRVAAGDALYGDVQFGTTPLSIYTLWAVVAVVGQQILAVKALSALFAGGSALLVARISRQGGATWFAAAVCAALMIPIASRFLSSLYTPLAMLLLLACESVALALNKQPGVRWAGAAGGLAGLSFAAKQNVGGLALLALLAAIVIAEPSRLGVRRALAAGAIFVAIVFATFGAMVASGGSSGALDALGLGKGSYLEYGAIPYHETLRGQVRALMQPAAWKYVVTGRDRDLLLSSPAVILPVVTAILLAAALVLSWSRNRHIDHQVTTAAVFAIAAFFSAFPRYDAVHLAWVAGPLLAACAISLSRIFRSRSPGLRSLVALATAGLVAFALVGPIVDLSTGRRVAVGLPHFAGAWMSPDSEAEAKHAVRRLHAALPQRKVFLVMNTASFFYLAAGLENPTRYDYPASTTIGRKATAEIVRGVEDGTVPAVCLDDAAPDSDTLRSVGLERRLRQLLHPGPNVGPCRLWMPKVP